MSVCLPVHLLSGKEVASARLDALDYSEQVRSWKESIALQAELNTHDFVLSVGDQQLADTARLSLHRDQLSEATHLTLVQKVVGLAERILTPDAPLILTQAQVPQENFLECLQQKGWMPVYGVIVVAADGTTLSPNCALADEAFPITVKVESNKAVQKRVEKEQQVTYISSLALDRSGWHREVSFAGPSGTPYADGEFLLDFLYPPAYPCHPPIVRFITKVYHSNVDAESGAISIDILADKWSPVLTMEKNVLSIQSLLADPNPHDPLHTQAADLFLQDRANHDNIVRDWVRKYA